LRGRILFQNQDFGTSVGRIGMVFRDLSVPTGPGGRGAATYTPLYAAFGTSAAHYQGSTDLGKVMTLTSEAASMLSPLGPTHNGQKTKEKGPGRKGSGLNPIPLIRLPSPPPPPTHITPPHSTTFATPSSATPILSPPRQS